MKTHSNKIHFLWLLVLLFIINASHSFAQAPLKINYIKGDVLVRMLPNENPYSLMAKVPHRVGLTVAKELSEYSNIWLLKFNADSLNINEMTRLLLSQPSVLYAQANHIVHLRAAPNDPQYSSQWQHLKINSEAAWDITTGGQTAQGTDIVVALMESADLLNHDDLHANQWINTAETPNNGIDDEGNGYIDDYNGWNVSTGTDDIGTGSHGTNCAGMIGAVGNNGIGVSGINWNVKIMDIAGYDNPFTEANIVSAYNYAFKARQLWNQTNGQQGAFVVATSASWGIDGGDPNDYPIWCSYYDDLGQIGILNVAATTNQHKDVDVYGDMPTACASDFMVGVTATNSSDVIDFAGWGKNTIELAAPGSSIYTTSPNDGYTTTSGTSFACPLTAGLIGLMYSIPCDQLESRALSDPEGTALLIKEALMDGVDKVAGLSNLLISGGRINAKKTLDTLMAMVCNTCASPFGAQTDTLDDTSASISFTDTNATVNYIIHLQQDGDSTWQTFTTSDTFFTFQGLTACTNYHYFVTSDCINDTISNPSSTVSFRTAGCKNCLKFNYCTSAGATSTPKFTVNSPTAMKGDYTSVPSTNFGADVNATYVYGELVLMEDADGDINDGCSTPTNAAALNGNIAVIMRGTCSFTQKVWFAQDAGAVGAIVINNVAGAPFDMSGNDNSLTIPAIMISQTDGNTLISSINNAEHPTAFIGTRKIWLDSLAIEGQAEYSGNNNGYYFDESGLYLALGANHTFTIQPGYGGSTVPSDVQIWVDLNQNGTFESNEKVYSSAQSFSGVLTDQFTVPSTALLGSTRMRIQLSDALENTQLPDVCGNFNDGEVEDYCVTILDNASTEKQTNSIDQLVIYPNPVSNVLTLTQKSNQIQSITVYSPAGKRIKSLHFTNTTSIQLPTSYWANGIYFFHLLDKNGMPVGVKKVSVMH